MLATLLRRECEDLYFEGLPEGEFVFANGLEYTASDYIASECSWIYRWVGSLSRSVGAVYHLAHVSPTWVLRTPKTTH